jgi:hypothetical protein
MHFYQYLIINTICNLIINYHHRFIVNVYLTTIGPFHRIHVDTVSINQQKNFSVYLSNLVIHC